MCGTAKELHVLIPEGLPALPHVTVWRHEQKMGYNTHNITPQPILGRVGKQKQKEFAKGSQRVAASPLLYGRCLRCLLCACVGPLFGANRGHKSVLLLRAGDGEVAPRRCFGDLDAVVTKGPARRARPRFGTGMGGCT